MLYPSHGVLGTASVLKKKQSGFPVCFSAFVGKKQGFCFSTFILNFICAMSASGFVPRALNSFLHPMRCAGGYRSRYHPTPPCGHFCQAEGYKSSCLTLLEGQCRSDLM